ncbi:PREDICTED: kinesin-like protein NACK1 [Erythranthe guttata]|uniref:kinesin-like protein NACK1 n=1 Tax=Erythranthe guttata TaxID=4155 RepID=UPI00064D974F|nr:PREDICTED: kinesin-like protein NACK1 [Erythranthe guttata]XP_012835774.1 PREDICTED: kinesin-like protein NACK1 [Erythranthe guttata]XP_012835775.1 PREDICTED: kinesin-like protein NACK1 [Erythranthe guttata]XP_012844287.1 PREDICTED: kinesin-like protein NACK1 [Erythranthe guttata]|eukprot:XP_012835773.1 PREDICTED: kinesin-like protein NACK1 [Erythranthe guttata]
MSPKMGKLTFIIRVSYDASLMHHSKLTLPAQAKRKVGETSINEISSRSHEIITLTIESCSRDFFGRDNASTLTAAVNFVDLAASERAS